MKPRSTLFWLHPKLRKRQARPVASHRSVRERVEAAHLRVDKLKEQALAIAKTEPSDNSPKCKRCSRRTHSNDDLCIVCQEMERK